MRAASCWTPPACGRYTAGRDREQARTRQALARAKGDVMSWYVQIMGETLGPFIDVDLVRMAATGRIQQDTPVSHEATGPWSTAMHVRGLFEAAQHADMPVVPAGPAKPVEPVEDVAAVGSSASIKRGHEESDGPYKVITQRDRWFAGRFDPDRLEGAINA